MRHSSKRIELSDDYMFAEIMRQDKETCRRVLEAILGFEVEILEYLENEKFFKSDAASKAVRLDVIAKNTGAVYDIEMQKMNIGNIPRRARYYQSQIDVSELDRGIEYDGLKDSYVIFICGFDLFGMGEYIYRFENFDIEKKLPLGDGAKVIVINTKGTKGDISDELRELITYIDKPDEVGKSLTSDLIKELEARVVNQNQDKDWRKKRMRAEADKIDYINKGKREGRKEGMAIGEARIVSTMYKNGFRPQQIASATNIDIKEIQSILEKNAVMV